MLEGQLALPGELTRLAGDDDVLLAQRGERRGEVGSGGSGDGLERALPEGAPEHGGVRDELALEALQRVQPRREQALHGLGKLGRRGAALLGDALHHRLGEERVAPRAFGQRLGQLAFGARLAQQALDQPADLARGERFEEVRRRDAPQRAPARPALEQLIAREGDL